VHERAIFDELTHLKRMQIQYGKVREEVLVRSLVQNFCRMHAIHPSHFRRITTFHQWEKFLYGIISKTHFWASIANWRLVLKIAFQIS
jgi:hypothetical protein